MKKKTIAKTWEIRKGKDNGIIDVDVDADDEEEAP